MSCPPPFPSPLNPPDLLRALFQAAVEAALPERVLPAHLPPPPEPGGRLIVIGAGKSSARMAQVVRDHYAALGVPASGHVVTRYGHAVPCEPIQVHEAAHPVPDEASLKAAATLKAAVNGLTSRDVVIALISGGGSALLVEPGPGLTLADKQAVHRALLASGASIREMNTVRRHLSGIKGGRLAALCHPAQLHTLLISDVPGDRPCDIASGPTVGDPSTAADALAILDRYRLPVPQAVRQHLLSPAADSVAPSDPRLSGHRCTIVAAPQASLQTAAEVARAAGVTPWILGDALEGEARDMAATLAGLARQAALHGTPFKPPCVLLSGGESTVTLAPRASEDTEAQAGARGGRNVEFLLALALALRDVPQVWALAADTDGIDGTAEVAGAVLHPDTLARAAQRGRSAVNDLDRHDGHGFFGALGDAVMTGPTLTNVNDFRAILVLPGGDIADTGFSTSDSAPTLPPS